MPYFTILHIITCLLFCSSFAMAQENKDTAWKVLGLTAEQIQHKGITTSIMSSQPTHRLIIPNAIFPFFEPTPVAMSPDKKKFYIVNDGKVAAYSANSGRRLWETISNFYENKLLATNTGVYAEYFDADAHRLYGMGVGAGGIHFFNSEDVSVRSIENVSLVPAMSKDESFIALQGDSFDEISVLNTKTFEKEEVSVNWETLQEMDPWKITMLYYENLSHDDYMQVREKFWTKYGITPLRESKSELYDIYTLYSLPKASTLYPTLNIQATAYSVQKEYAFAGDSSYIFILNTLTGEVKSHKLSDTKRIQSLSFSADGQSLLALNDTGGLRIYKNGQWQQQETGIQGDVHHMAVDEHGDRVWITQDDVLYSISLNTSEMVSSICPSFIYALAFSPKLQNAVLLAHDEDTLMRDVFIPLVNTDNSIDLYFWERMEALYILFPELNEKEVLSFDAETLLLKNAFFETRTADGSRIHFSYDLSSTPIKAITTSNLEYFSLEHMHAVLNLNEIAPHIYAKIPKVVNDYAELMTVYNITAQQDINVFTMPQYLYPNVSALTKVYFTHQGTFMSLHENDSVMLWDIKQKTPVPLLTYHFFKDGNYLVTNESGNFFSPSEKNFNSLHWVDIDNPSKVINFEKLADRYRDENIIKKTLHNQ